MLLIDSDFVAFVENIHLKTDMCKSESSQRRESRAQQADSSKACSKPYSGLRAFDCCINLGRFAGPRPGGRDGGVVAVGCESSLLQGFWHRVAWGDVTRSDSGLVAAGAANCCLLKSNYTIITALTRKQCIYQREVVQPRNSCAFSTGHDLCRAAVFSSPKRTPL